MQPLFYLSLIDNLSLIYQKSLINIRFIYFLLRVFKISQKKLEI